MRVYDAVGRAVGERGMIRVQMPLVLGDRSAPEPDVAVVPSEPRGYSDAHPRTALLVVEVAHSSVAQDRLTKASIYARAGIAEYWLVNLVDQRVEVYREPVRKKGPYRRIFFASRGERIDLVAFPGASVAVDDLLPPPK